MVDVKNINKHCNHAGCTSRPAFNFEGEKKGIFCSEHKSDGMVDVQNKHCNHAGCTTQPAFNFEGQKKGA